MKLWQKYNQEQLQQFIDISDTYRDFCSKIGYKRISGKTLYEIKAFYPTLDIEKFNESQEGNRVRCNPNFEDLVGQKFNHLTVLRQGSYSNGKLVRWICRCDCGNITTPIRAAHLKDGHTKSCGCLQRKRSVEAHLIDLTGLRFGKLVVLEREEFSISDREGHWICQCDCGNKKTVLARALINGSTLSCGCLKSKGEMLIGQLLELHNIEYIKEYNFPDLLSDSGNRLRFDFAIFKNNELFCLIEYQGEQHYLATEYFGGIDAFEKRILHDERKKKYCRDNNIKLLEIPYSYSQIDCEKVLSFLWD